MTKNSSIIRGKYQHYKNNLYELIDIAQHSESLDYMVIYRELYGNYNIWVRPLDNFFENIEIDGITRKRFEYIGS